MVQFYFDKCIQFFNANHKRILIGFFSIYLVVGLFTFSDYGLSWDENSQWKNNGHANYNFIVHHDHKTLVEGIDKYHGPAFELVLIFFEKIFSLQDTQDIFLIRHLLTFLVFFVSAFFFYLVAKKLVKTNGLAFVGLLMYVLSPAIYAHSFFNSKDAVFLSFFVISIYWMLVFHEKPTFKNAFSYALFAAFTIDIRIIGILLPLFTLLLFAIDHLSFLFRKTAIVLNYKKLLIYFFFLVPLIILFWPVLWLDPIYHFIEALKENSKYPWDGLVMYFGEYITASKLPWHYLLFWNFVARPIVYSLLFLTGLVFMGRGFIKAPFSFFYEKKQELILLCWFFLPLVAVVLFNSTAFDTGRHLYFMHGAFILIAIYGLQHLFVWIKSVRLKAIVFVFLIVSFIGLVLKMAQLHPYEYLYFNSAVSGDLKKAQQNFEMDYWGLASRSLLEQIVEKDSSTNIKLHAENYPFELNAYILNASDRKRIQFVSKPEDANYSLVDYRWHKRDEYTYQKEFCSVTIDNACIASAFSVRSSEKLYALKGKRLLYEINDCEHVSELWSQHSLIELNDSIYKRKVMKLEKGVEYSDNMVVKGINGVAGKIGLIAKIKFSYNASAANNDAKWVITAESASKEPYLWRSIASISAQATHGWKEQTAAIELPELHSDNDIIRIYLWNINKTEIFIDDIEVELIEEDL